MLHECPTDATLSKAATAHCLAVICMKNSDELALKNLKLASAEVRNLLAEMAAQKARKAVDGVLRKKASDEEVRLFDERQLKRESSRKKGEPS